MYHTAGLILRKEPWGETAWLVTALTEDFGKIRLLAQGARKHGAKLQGHLEPGSLVALSFVVGKSGYRFTTARMIEFFPGIRASVSKLRAFAFILRVLDTNLFEDRDRAAELFRTVRAVLFVLERSEHLATVRRLLAWFRIQFLRFLGVFPFSHSTEAIQCAAVLLFGSLPLEKIETADVREEVLEEELARLALHLGGIAHMERTVISAHATI